MKNYVYGIETIYTASHSLPLEIYESHTLTEFKWKM